MHSSATQPASRAYSNPRNMHYRVATLSVRLVFEHMGTPEARLSSR